MRKVVPDSIHFFPAHVVVPFLGLSKCTWNYSEAALDREIIFLLCIFLNLNACARPPFSPLEDVFHTYRAIFYLDMFRSLLSQHITP